MQKASDKAINWSPQGTYLIVIKPEKVQFLGGHDMIPIITLDISKVDSVSMSPCERYVLCYAPMNDNAFSIWDFKLVN